MDFLSPWGTIFIIYKNKQYDYHLGAFSFTITFIIISFTLILAADWSIAVGYWIVFHCFSLLVNFRMGISVLSSLLKSRLNILSSFAMVTMVDLKFTGLDVFLYYKTHKKNKKKNQKKKIKKN